MKVVQFGILDTMKTNDEEYLGKNAIYMTFNYEHKSKWSINIMKQLSQTL